jgi:hypothetical protein
MQTTVRHYRVDRRQISFFKFILEAYDHMAVLTTVDPHQALVKVTVAPGCEKLVDDIIDGLKCEFEVVPVNRPVCMQGQTRQPVGRVAGEHAHSRPRETDWSRTKRKFKPR